jgi:hypothetical protein
MQKNTTAIEIDSCGTKFTRSETSQNPIFSLLNSNRYTRRLGIPDSQKNMLPIENQGGDMRKFFGCQTLKAIRMPAILNGRFGKFLFLFSRGHDISPLPGYVRQWLTASWGQDFKRLFTTSLTI